MVLTGIDVSHHQGSIDWRAVASSGHDFAILKRTQGVSYKYRGWGDNNAPQAAAAGLTVGHYHFLTTFDSGAAQARYFVSVVGNFSGQIAVLDVETNPWNNSHPSSATAHAFADEFHRLTGGHPLVLYTGRWYWHGILGNPHGADIGPLWHSEYETSQAEINDGPEGANYGGWSGATFWQYTSSGRCPGVAGNCDLNIFYGSRSDLAKLTRQEIVEPPPEPPKPLEEEYDMLYVVQGDKTAHWWFTDFVTKRHIKDSHEVAVALWLNATNGTPKAINCASGGTPHVIPQWVVDNIPRSDVHPEDDDEAALAALSTKVEALPEAVATALGTVSIDALSQDQIEEAVKSALREGTN